MFKKQQLQPQQQQQQQPPPQAPGVYLPPPPYPMGILSEFCVHQQPIVLRIRKVVSWSGDDFDIKDVVSGQPIFRIDAKMFSFRQKKTLVDYNGRPLFEFERKMWKLLAQYVGYKCGDENATLFNIEKTGIINAKLHITFNSAASDGRPEHWTLKGKWYSGHSQIINTDGIVVADINRDYTNLRQFCDYCLLSSMSSFEGSSANDRAIILFFALASRYANVRGYHRTWHRCLARHSHLCLS